jgi:hypothetical protein
MSKSKGVYLWRKSTSPHERFWHFVAPMTDDRGCWEWLGARSGFGYGKSGYEGKFLAAHRVSWEIHFGLIPEGMLVCHRCDNPSCCNPSHLFLGTAADNTRDMWNKGRSQIRHAWEAWRSRTECKYGHPLDAVRKATGHRYCRTCNVAMQKRRYYERKAEAGAS